jgi:hypothetical protein
MSSTFAIKRNWRGILLYAFGFAVLEVNGRIGHGPRSDLAHYALWFAVLSAGVFAANRGVSEWGKSAP